MSRSFVSMVNRGVVGGPRRILKGVKAVLMMENVSSLFVPGKTFSNVKEVGETRHQVYGGLPIPENEILNLSLLPSSEAVSYTHLTLPTSDLV